MVNRMDTIFPKDIDVVIEWPSLKIDFHNERYHMLYKLGCFDDFQEKLSSPNKFTWRESSEKSFMEYYRNKNDNTTYE